MKQQLRNVSQHNRFASLLASLTLLLIAAVPGIALAVETITYYHLDALGSPVAASDEQGNLKWREDYKPYGEKIRNEPASSSNSRAYTGHPHDNDTGLTYAGARYYDPVIGRFLAIDPKGFGEGNLQSFNRYNYANNNPYIYSDPDGRSPRLLDPQFWQSVARLANTAARAALGIEKRGGANSEGSLGPRNPGMGEDGVPKAPESPLKTLGDTKAAQENLGPAQPSKGGPGEGWKWQDKNGNGFRIQEGDPDAPFPSQREPYVQIRDNGKVIGRDGSPLASKNDPNAHVPVREWENWPTPYSPK